MQNILRSKSTLLSIESSMDFLSHRHLLNVPQAFPPCTFPRNFETTHPSSTSLPLIGILVLGIMISTFFLIGYYMLVIKCCLTWHHVDHIRRFSLSRHGEDPSSAYSTQSEPRGLEEAVIRLIPVIHYKPQEGDAYFGERSFSECAVCLSEFQQNEKLRVIPSCSHVFHIDCIDVWLHNNAHCPLCRRIVSLTSQVNVDQLNLVTPRPSPQDQSQSIENLIGSDEGFVVIDLDGENEYRDQTLQEELQTGPIISVSSQRKLLEQKKAKKLQKVTSLGDECIGIRAKSERFSIQAMRRSFSMDSSVNRQFHEAVQQALQQENNEHVHEEVCGASGRMKRSFFSFGHGSRSRSAVLPVYLDP